MPANPDSHPGGGYGGYGRYGGYGGYGGYGALTDNQMQRTLEDYLLILRERAWYIVLVFALCFSATVIYTFTRTPEFQSVASVQVFRREQVVMQVQSVVDNDIRSAEDLNTQIKVIESGLIIDRVAKRLTGEDLRSFLAPYEKTSADSAFVGDILNKNRKIVQQRATLVVNVAYQHADRFVAAKVANLFVDEYFTHNTRLRLDDSSNAGRGRRQDHRH